MIGKEQSHQFVQCFQISIDDLKELIKQTMENALVKLPINDSHPVVSETYDELLTPKEVSKLLKISPTTLWRHRKKGILKAQSISGRRVYFSKKEVYNLINNMAQ